MNDTKKTEETKSTQERMKEAHDALRRELLNKFQVCGDYACPEAESGFASGVFVAEPDFEALTEFCKYVSSAGASVYDGEWGADALFTFIKNKLVNYHNGDNYDITLSFGGMQPVLALFPFLLVYSKITYADVEFLHDKWEARGDYSADKHVGLKLVKGKITADTLHNGPNSGPVYYPSKTSSGKSTSKKSAGSSSMWKALSDDVTVEFKDKIFVLTGFDDVEEKKLIDLIVANGGTVKTSVVLATNYLVVNLNYRGGETTKYKRAVELIGKGKEIHIISGGKLCPEAKKAPSARLFHAPPQAPDTNVETTLLWGEVRTDVDVVYENKTFVLTMFTAEETNALTTHITARGGIVKDKMVSTADYLVVSPQHGANETQKYARAVEMMQKGKAIQIVDCSTILPSLDPSPRQTYIQKVYRTESGTFVTVNDKLISCQAPGKYIKIPMGVKEIGKDVFRDNMKLRTLVIPSSVTEIGESAFHDCSALTKVFLSNGLKRICDSAFKGCSALSQVDLPDSLIEIGDFAFMGCAFRGVAIPAGVTKIGEGAFSSWDLHVAAIPDSVTGIHEAAFPQPKQLGPYPLHVPPVKCVRMGVAVDGVIYSRYGQTLLYYPPQRKQEKFVVPDHVEFIGHRAFSGADQLKQIVLPEGLTEIRDEAFAFCHSLEKINLPESLTEIGDGAFWECKNLTDVAFPNRLQNIGAGAFYDCRGLTKLIIPPNVETIGFRAFSGCLGIVETKILSDHAKIEEFDLPLCTQTVFISNRHDTYTTVDNVVYSKDGKTLVHYPANRDGESFTVPEGVKVISKGAFSSCKKLKSLTISKNVEVIEGWAFTFTNIVDYYFMNENVSFGGFMIVGEMPEEIVFHIPRNAGPDMVKKLEEYKHARIKYMD